MLYLQDKKGDTLIYKEYLLFYLYNIYGLYNNAIIDCLLRKLLNF